MLDQNNLFPDEKIKKEKLTTNKRDVMVHVACTIMNRVGKIEVIGEKENEIAQFAVELDYRQMPLSPVQAKQMFEKLSKACFDRMLIAGLIKP